MAKKLGLKIINIVISKFTKINDLLINIIKEKSSNNSKIFVHTILSYNFAGISTLKTLSSRGCRILSRTSFLAKLILSNNILCPFVYALKNFPSSTLMPEAEKLFWLNLTNKSSILVSALKLNLNNESLYFESLFNIDVIY